METWPTLYKMIATGAIQQWSIRVEEYDLPSYQYIVEHGQLDGKLQETSTIIATGKNIGRANETGVYKQCCLEADSLWTKQKDRKGYSENIPNAKPLRPMLAKSYDKDSHHIKFPCFIQPKLDGLRCLAKRTKDGVELLSRQGKRFTSIPHIEQQLMWLKPGQILDGELYIHGEDFQNIISAIKRDTPSKRSKDIEYHVYDMISNEDYKDRFEWLSQYLLPKHLIAIPTVYGIVKTDIPLVAVCVCNNPSEIWEKHTIFTKDGYEGAILRNMLGPYEINKRSFNLQKVKRFIDMEFPIVGVEECKGKMIGMCSFVCQTQKGATFKCMPEGSEEYRRQLYKDWQSGCIKPGDLLTVKFFAWTSSENPVPRFPIGKLRNYE